MAHAVWTSGVRYLRTLSFPLVVAGCASTGATFGSGVGDVFLEHPPYYAGARAGSVSEPSVSTGHLPVTYQRGGSQSPIFDPPLTPALAELLNEMNGTLDSLRLSVPLAVTRTAAPGNGGGRIPPDVYFGCITPSGMFDDDCAERGDSALGRKGQTMRLAVGRPSAEWIAWAGELMEGAGVDQTLVITLEVGQYLTRQRGITGIKEVELGTGYVERLPWLTSLETPVSVVQLTGALVGRDGKAIRIGAEGLLARRTNLPMSSLGAQVIITEADIDELRVARRGDLPGEPLVWQTGLRNLVAQLMDSPPTRSGPVAER